MKRVYSNMSTLSPLLLAHYIAGINAIDLSEIVYHKNFYSSLFVIADRGAISFMLL